MCYCIAHELKPNLKINQEHIDNPVPNDIEHHTEKTESYTVSKPKYNDKQWKPWNTRKQAHTHSNKTLNDGCTNNETQNTPKNVILYQF